MWQNNKTVSRTYTSKDSQNCHAIISGISGWQKIKTGSSDGVSNVFHALNAARAGAKKVDVYIINNQIERVVMR
ncbi:hypothetical protein [Roseobacter litoralis]|uniref:hypothetical protein n=1 Tax=Roseobacter litoralis TaxID=42443 RepID=UPI0024922909|nr:hypothetical protein [Roseobacter litoralis]